MAQRHDFDYVYDELDRYFDRIDETRERMGHKPSEVEKLLDLVMGIGHVYRDWWEESGEVYE